MVSGKTNLLLQSFYNLLLDEEGGKQLEEKTNELFDAIEIDKLMVYLIYTEKPTDEDVICMELLIKILQYLYNNTDFNLMVSDDNYDKLYNSFMTASGKDIVGSSNLKDRPILFHNYPDLRGTLDKIHFVKNSDKPKGENRKSFENWMVTVTNKLGRVLTYEESYVTLTPKWDGLSVILECDENSIVERALTRGYVTTNEAIDLSAMFQGLSVKDITDYKGEKAIKTEVVMNKMNFDKLSKKEGKYKNQRSVVSSILNSKELDRNYLEYLTIVPLQVQFADTREIILPEFTLNTFPSITINLFDTRLEDAIKTLLEEMEKPNTVWEGINIDGVVIRLTNKSLHEKLGRENGINKFEVAYKLPPAEKTTVIKDVDFSVGILGAITPVANVEPIIMKGNTIKNISLGSMDRFKSLDLHYGDEVVIKYDVIPYLEKRKQSDESNSELIVSPTHCPYCNSMLVKEPVLKCINEECDCRKIGKLINYVEKMDIPNLNEGKITTLFKEGFLRNIEDLYILKGKKKQVCLMDGFGEKSFDKIIKGIEGRNKVSDYVLVGSLGIPYIGRRILKRILDIYYLGELIDICINNDKDKLYKVEGIKEKTATKIIEGINNNHKLIMFLQEKLNVIHETNKFEKIVCFTKVRDKDFEKYLITHNIGVADKYSKEIDILIIPDDMTESSKIEKAKKHNKDIIKISDAYRLFNYK